MAASGFEQEFAQHGVHWQHIVGDVQRLDRALARWHVSGSSFLTTGRDISRAEFDDFRDFYVLRALTLLWHADKDVMRVVPISLWVDDGRVISYAAESVDAFSQARKRLSDNPDWVVSPTRLVYYLLDELMTALFPFLDGLNERIARLEDEVFRSSRPGRVERRIFRLKREALRARRALASMRDAIAQLVRHWTTRSPHDPFYYMELYDHMIRHFDTVDTYRELVNSVLDLHLSNVNNRLNEIVKALTLVTTVLLPASLMAGLYGMNFDYIPLKHDHYGFFVVIAIICAISLAVYWIFRRRKWL